MLKDGLQKKLLEEQRLENGAAKAEALQGRKDQGKWTALGILAISLWSAAIAGARITGKAAGAMTTMGVAYLIGGVGACSIYAALGKLMKCVSHPRSYYVQCGVPFTMHSVGIFMSMHFAVTDTEVVVLTVINCLWPHLMSILLVVVFQRPWRWSLVPGIIGAVCMVLVTTIHPGENGNPLVKMFEAMLAIWPAALCAYFGAVCWAAYSALSSRYALECRARIALATEREERVDEQWDGTLSAVPFLTLVTGVVLLACDQFITEPHPGPFDARFFEAMAYMTLVPICGCRFAWDFALARGDMMILNTYSYLTPFLATCWNSMLLGTPANPFAFLGAAGLGLCAIVVKKSILA